MKNQLFRNTPDLKNTLEILKLFGLNSLDDNHSFTKENLVDLKTVEKMNENINEISKFYIPCKAKYLKDLNEKKCITILRQFVKIHHYKCIGMEKSIKGKKTMTYRLIYSNEDYLTSPETKKNEEYVLSFE